LQNRFEDVLRQESDRRDRDAVAHEAIGLVVIAGQLVIVGQPHQTRGLARRQESRPHRFAFNDYDRLRLDVGASFPGGPGALAGK
jgi:hypothetical protein